MSTDTTTRDSAKESAGGWLDAEVDGRSVRAWIVTGLVIAAVTLGFGAWWTYGLDRGTSMQGGTAAGEGEMAGDEMAGDGGGMDMMSSDAPRLPAVFAYVPSDATYTPLREIVMVTWQDEADARLLTSTEEVEAAGADGLVTLKPSGVVVNAPVLTWPGGQR